MLSRNLYKQKRSKKIMMNKKGVDTNWFLLFVVGIVAAGIIVLWQTGALGKLFGVAGSYTGGDSDVSSVDSACISACNSARADDFCKPQEIKFGRKVTIKDPALLRDLKIGLPEGSNEAVIESGTLSCDQIADNAKALSDSGVTFKLSKCGDLCVVSG